jgi:ubiquinol-cytochrome c reductase cytochrome b subunit
MRRLRQLIQWFDNRTGTSELIMPLAKHLVPPDSNWLYVFGSATLFVFLTQVITGVGLAMMYQPSSGAAYESLKYITLVAPLGRILRGIHNFGASAMIVLVGIHMIRVYLTAAFKYPREMSWITGLILLLLTILMAFTGQLLRWDSNGVWSAIVAAEQAGRVPLIGKWVAYFILGGETIGGATLGRFFAIHVFLIPGLIFALVGLHIYLVLYNGITELPKAGRPVVPATYRQWYQTMLSEKGIPFWPDVGWRDAIAGIIVVAIVIILGVWKGAPEIGSPPDPANINTVPRPDWYFLWLFAIFALMPRNIETVVLAFGPVVLGIILIAMPLVFRGGERHPQRRPWAIGIVVIMVTIVVLFSIEAVKSPWSPDFNAKPLTSQVIGEVGAEAQTGAVLVFNKGCLYCHRISGDGGLRGPDLTDVGNRLNNQELTIRIVNGGGNMPAFGPSLTDKDLKALVAFLNTRVSK